MAERPVPPADITPEKMYMEWLPTQFKGNPEVQGKLKGTTGSFQFDITGDGGGSYCLILKDGQLSTQKGAMEKPDCTITMVIDNWRLLSQNKLDPQAAFMSGKLKFKGNMALVMKLGTILKA
jgi:putative sterol carrier protein